MTPPTQNRPNGTPNVQAECFSKVLDMVCTLRSFDQHVLQVNFHGFVDLHLVNFIHKHLVGCSSVFITVGPSLDDERCLRLVILMHQDLIIVEVGVHEAEQLIVGS
ncbi:hypothetical protein L3X38_042332 [Prunus dulcis]|uniref:Uncharacterized protein n=1 Tax=Prunus dulcis TaxID=3755 RepID=A0AAD4UUZ4_PRUDU|nr:hypothetical protein L3X38_042332 [Prunus dulcis]